MTQNTCIINARMVTVVIYKAFCLDVAQWHMNGSPSELIPVGFFV